MEEKEINLLDYIKILWKRRKFIIINFLIICIITAIYTLSMPKTFRASSVILPPQSGGGLTSLLTSLPMAGLSGLGGAVSDEANAFIAILKSRTIMESVAKKYNLMDRYKSENMEETILSLRESVGIKVSDEGTIGVGVNFPTKYFSGKDGDDEARQLCSDMANFFIMELDRINKELQTTQARYHREFIEKRYLQNLRDIEKAEQEFKKFQEENNAIALPEQMKAAITMAANIKAQIIASEVKFGALKTSLKADHPEVQKAKVEVRELKSALEELKGGTTTEQNTLSLFPNFKNAPELGIQLIQLQRELEVQNKLYEFLIQQYEQAKLQEAKDTPTVQVLDKAVPPVKRIKPKRKVLVLICGFLSLLLSSFYIITLEFFKIDKSKLKKLFS